MICGLYGILTNPKVGYEELARIMVDEGLTIIQLRIKDKPIEQVEDTALKLRGIIPEGVTYIINDDPYLAKKVQADGVHVGQNDISYEKARQIMGEKAIIGISTHNRDQTLLACKKNPDYIGIGPVFPTPTKKNPDPVIGIEGMKKMLSIATVPSVCLGGIDHSNILNVLKAGAQNVCAVRCINGSSKPAEEIRMLKKAIKEAFMP